MHNHHRDSASDLMELVRTQFGHTRLVTMLNEQEAASEAAPEPSEPSEPAQQPAPTPGGAPTAGEHG